ncbi:hypothetical protein SERLA73DRAFT_156314 [Serpula lacrymans var. lacrymans S7.3]|uniref:Uncharacterized protein n=1 Tax=Serpula lacrymans var. lacrymans (strain S7.3) TaxID=936435 RepID=F8QDX1_SERL3|nr:hypothetical protein SERLA73DRAFT_156314 [Serpula lacrymans var. lacrymans S7.3]
MQIQGLLNGLAQVPGGILIQSGTLNHTSPYSMSQIVLTENWLLAHVQHNCIDNQCEASGTRPVYQEHQLTDQTQPSLTHKHPSNIVMNTAQMWDAIHIQYFQIPLTSLDTGDILTASVAKEVDACRFSIIHPTIKLLTFTNHVRAMVNPRTNQSQGQEKLEERLAKQSVQDQERFVRQHCSVGVGSSSAKGQQFGLKGWLISSVSGQWLQQPVKVKNIIFVRQQTQRLHVINVLHNNKDMGLMVLLS